jgi:hypothetical protein
VANQKREPPDGAAKEAGEGKRTAEEVNTETEREEPLPTPAKRQDKKLPTLTLDKAYETAYYYTGKVSEISRQLGLAGLAIIWIFKTDTKDGPIIDENLFLPGLLLVVGLALDLLQYVVMGELWERYAKRKDDLGETEFRVPKKLNWAGDVFYYLKLISVLIAYCYLISFLWSKVFMSPADLVTPPPMPGVK